MPNLGTTELIIILVIILIIFGAGKLPQIGDALGDSLTDVVKVTGFSLDHASETDYCIRFIIFGDELCTQW